MGKRKATRPSAQPPNKKSRTSRSSKAENEIESSASSSSSNTKMVAALVRKINQVFKSHANPKEAVGMKQYMRGQFEYFGIKSPLRKELSKEFLQENLATTQMHEFIRKLWDSPQREHQYFAMDYLKKHMNNFSSDEFEKNLELAKHLITTKSWWDTVDLLACHFVGHLVKQCPSHGVPAMESWIQDENMWLRRSAILHQLSYKVDTDRELLFKFCTTCSHEKEFFIQKSIGWALREFARTDTVAVKAFVKGNKDKLSKLSYREATKHLTGV